MSLDPFLGNLVVKELEIALERFCISHAIDPRAWLLTAKARSFWAVEMDALILQVSVDVPKIGLGYVKVPETWWDHVKERWAPAWFLKRWPVEYQVYEAVALLEKLPMPAKEIDQRFGLMKFAYLEMGKGKEQ